ncbi:hypothetical protein NOSIN_11305 [Nocardiopsis sinuspersici]|uniref:Abortive infection protein n=1 Tax=Nocardiopsis sinuspersici TaxID=501010 RepID=A0A1V3C1F7_9ACTN|nr:hypothetical protein NOSIN_11305 [Nocardiopsis sinuspersici]
MLVAGLALIAGSAVWLAVNGATGVRYSADHHDTVPMWHRWVPAMAGLVLVRLVPPREPSATRVFAERTSHALVNQGMTGLFLGYLWSRYRVMWPVLTVHSLMNAAPIMLGAL